MPLRALNIRPLHERRQNRLLLGLVVTALLFVSALPVVEASHVHPVNDTATECWLCGVSADMTATAGYAVTTFSTPQISTSESRSYPHLVRFLALPPLRGPPAHI